MKQIIRLLVMSSSLGVLLTISGCNTIRGIGQDVQRAGSAVESAAKK